MCAPTPESSGSTTSTLAPLVMSDCASDSWVASEPRAFWMMKSELDSPAWVNACFRYGASNSTYRVEDVVSGRITATEPLPALATDLSCAIAEKELLRSLIEIDAPLALPLEPEVAAELEAGAAAELLELLELLQPAATSTAARAAAAVRPARADTEYNGVPRSFTQTCRKTACARPDPYNPVTFDRTIGGNARSARRNVPVNTFVKPLKKR